MRAFVFIAVCVFYGAFVFPFSYFRNDDWLILGNGATVLPGDWSFLWRPTLVFNSHEETWFFRPGFKLATYLFYQLFGLRYWAWLVATLVLFWLAVWIGQRLTQRLNGRRAGVAFFVLLALCVHLQFGSLAWIAEGLMNLPQLLLLVGAASAFLHSKRTWGSVFASWLCFTLALAFKESSVVFLAWLAAAWWFHPQFQPQTPKERILPLLPMGVTAAIYLVVRLVRMPIYSGYLPVWEWSAFLNPAFAFVASLGVPLAALALWMRPKKKIQWNAVLFYAVFFLAWLAPHLGHSFFSPGWLLVPGFFFALTIAIHGDFEASEWRRTRRAAAIAVALVFGVTPVLYQGQKIKWWEWHKGQRQIVEIFRKAPADAYDQLTIFECSMQKETALPIWRVIGYSEGLRHAWRLIHENSISIRFLPCYTLRDPNPRELVLRWDFPHFEWRESRK